MLLPSDHTSLQFEHVIAQCDPAAWLPHYVPIIILPLSSHNRTVTLPPHFNVAPSDHTSLQFEHLIAQCDPAAWLPHYEPTIILPLFSHNCAATLSPCFIVAPKSLHKSPCHPTTLMIHVSSCSYHSGVTTSIHSTLIQSPSLSGKMASIVWCKRLWNLLIRKNGMQCMM